MTRPIPISPGGWWSALTWTLAFIGGLRRVMSMPRSWQRSDGRGRKGARAKANNITARHTAGLFYCLLTTNTTIIDSKAAFMLKCPYGHERPFYRIYHHRRRPTPRPLAAPLCVRTRTVGRGGGVCSSLIPPLPPPQPVRLPKPPPPWKSPAVAPLTQKTHPPNFPKPLDKSVLF